MDDPHPELGPRDHPRRTFCQYGEPQPCQAPAEYCVCYQDYIAEFMAGNV